VTTQQLIDDLFREGVPYAESLNSRIQQVLVSMGGDSAVIAALFRDYFPYASTFNSRLRTGLELVGVSAADTADLFADGKNHTASLNERLLYAFAHAGPSISFTGSIAEGATTGRSAGTATLANPPVDIGTLTWSELGTGTGAALFAINSSTGAVTNSAALDYETATSYTYGIQVTDGVYTYTLLATISVTNVLEAASLSALALDDTDFPVSSAKTVNITGATSGSTITVATGALPAGMTLNSAARTISGTPTTEMSYSFTLRETLADSPNSPRDTALSITISAAPSYSVIIVPLLGQSNMAGRNAPSDDTDAGATDVYEWNCYAGDANYHTLQPVGSILHHINDGITGLDIDGPGIVLLNKIKTDNPSAIVVAVPVAYGSAALAIGTTTWNSSPTPAAGGSHFEEAVTETLAAITAAKAAYPGASITVTSMFVQGEQDAGNASSASMTAAATYTAYYAGLASFVADWRSRVTGTSVTHGKFVIGSIVPPAWIVGHAGGTYSALSAAINKAHVYASLNISNVMYSPGPDMAPGSHDGLHYQPASVARAQGLRLGSVLSDVTGPSVTAGTTQGGFVGTTANILLTHDDPVGHATFHFAGGADDALFEITDAYVNDTTQPQVRLISNAQAAGTYTLKVKARDGAGNFGADRTIAFTQAEPVATKSINYGAKFTTSSGFGTSTGVTFSLDIKAGQNFIFFAKPDDTAQGSYFTATVNGNACTNLGYTGGGTVVVMAYESAVDITGATIVAHWGAVTASFVVQHIWTTGYDLANVTSVGGAAWTSPITSPFTTGSITCPTGGIVICAFFSGNAFSTATSGTLLGEDNTGWFGAAVLYRESTGTLGVTCGGGASGATLRFAIAPL